MENEEKIINIAAYILKSIIDKKNDNGLSKARLTKLFYLIDWKSELDNNRQITDIQWYFHQFGPYVDDVMNALRYQTHIFKVYRYPDSRGGFYEVILLNDLDFKPKLDLEDQKVIDHVIHITVNLNWDQFIELVYGTFPVFFGVKGQFLNLKEAAILRRKHSVNNLSKATQ